MFDEKVEVNSHGVNAKIKAHILSDKEMREIGFTNHYEPSWYFCRPIKFPQTKRYRGFDISFSVSIPNRIDVLNEDFCQPYDYQYMLHKNPTFKPALIVYEQVEEFKGVLSGHVK